MLTYQQLCLAFAATRFPEVVAVGLLLAIAARRWRDDRAAAALLAAAGLVLGLHVAAEAPVLLRTERGGAAVVDPVWERAFGQYLIGDYRDYWSVYWLVALLPALAAACGFAALFLRRDPAAGRSGRGTGVE